eukprot:Tamp_19888.p1 GENE.Tamp_19888~~Tamp_19888.p1  ORF type:complete len:132 (-),score=55.65 Tamp_19888:385-780(-)
MMAPEHETEEKEVTAADQANINEFSRLNVKFHEIEEDLKAKQEWLVNLQDSSNEVMMMLDDSEPVKFVVGESYVDISQESATEHIERMVEETEAEVSKMQADLAGVKGRMKELKSLLTVKFGKSINLEEEE